MSCKLENDVAAVYAEPLRPHDPSCGCYSWGHYDPDGKPCHHLRECAAHELARALAERAIAEDA